MLTRYAPITLQEQARYTDTYRIRKCTVAYTVRTHGQVLSHKSCSDRRPVSLLFVSDTSDG